MSMDSAISSGPCGSEAKVDVFAGRLGDACIPLLKRYAGVLFVDQYCAHFGMTGILA
jgi:hypothetical protein